MAEKHREVTFEQELVASLLSHGWQEGDPKRYDRALALYPDDLIDWLQETQPQEWAKLAAFYHGDPTLHVLEYVAKLLDKEGALALLRRGFKDGNARFQLCQFKPSHGFNPQLQALYDGVRLRVVRQVHYSLHNENSIDVVLFANGIPLATLELKTDFTQSVQDAIRQYKYDRPPRDPATRQEEPLLAFKRRALVHFAVSTDEVHMTTRLAGAETAFLPFNLGCDQGKGNPENPAGYRTSYLWERVLARDSFLEILGRFIHLEKQEKGERIVFPRYHQWEVVTQLVAATRAEGTGHKYLVQHSAGSGKSNSIAWLAHQLGSLHDAADHKIFDSVIVVTDRTVLDKQLQDTIFQFEHKDGVVYKVTDEGVKSHQLVEALVERRPIIIVTIQTFPFVLETIRREVSLAARSFAVIADEAHSSQTGATATMLKRVLTAEQIEEGEEVSTEDIMLATMEARLQPPNVSFYAFTATPKAKTLELFGRRPAPGSPPAPFHVYSMRQAIEEGFILDVLKNYTPYRLAYRLAYHGEEVDEQEVEKAEGLKQLARWLRLNPYNIAQKVAIVVEHFREHIGAQIAGRAKSMVVTGSRKEAVRYKLAMDAYLKEMGYGNLRALVAFSGEVNDPDSGPDSFSEANMNPDLKRRDIRTAFASDEFRILIVANKFQTGFDQPLLAAMYVDKRLAGVTAVQTLSRLNRTCPGKTQTFVLDFVNKDEEILAAFAPYYRTAELAGVSDPNIIHALQNKLDGERIYTKAEVDAFCAAYFDPKGTQKLLQARIAPAVDRFRVRLREAEESGDKAELDTLGIFRKDLGSFVRAYEFLAQIFDYGDTDLEKRAVFYRHLQPWLKVENARTPIDLSAVELTHYRMQDLGQRAVKLEEERQEYKLQPLGEVGTAAAQDPQMAPLVEIIRQVNDLFAGDVREVDMLAVAHHVSGRMLQNLDLAQQAASNSKEQFAMGDYLKVFMDTLVDALDGYQGVVEQVLAQEGTRAGFERLVLELVYKGFAEKREGQTGQDAN
ncbi:MAG: type I restriction endonuclease [Caldilineaceae bacterium]